MKRFFIKSACMLLLACPLWSQSQNDSLPTRFLDEVILTDTKFESKRSESGKTVVRIGPEELARFEGKSVLELINAQSGIEINASRSRTGEVPGVYIRGGRGRQTIVYIDGVRVNDPSSFANTFDLRLLDSSGLYSIEIVKGANSTLYGSNAAAGVIYITTKQGAEGKIVAQLSSSVGTHQTAADQNYEMNRSRHALEVRGRSKSFRYGTFLSHQYTDGISSLVTAGNEEDKNSILNTGMHVGYQIKDRWNIDLKARYSKLDSDYDESFGLQDAPYSFSSEQKGVFINLEYALQKGEMRFTGGYNDFDSENISAFPGRFSGQNLTFDLYVKNTYSEKLSVIYGLNLNREAAQLGEKRSFTVFDPYVSVQWDILAPFKLNSGVRLNTHSEYGSTWVYSLNPVYRLLDGPVQLKAFGSYARSYITPTLNQLFGDFGANAALKPETNTSLELGAESTFSDGFRVSMLYFERAEENFVFFDGPSFQFINAPETVDVNGLEVEFFWKPSKKMDLKGNYTFTQRKGDNAIRIPKHKGFLQWGFYLGEASGITAQYAYTGKRLDTDFITFSDVELDPISVLNLSFSHELVADKFRLFAHIDNVLNERYQEIIGYSALGRNVRLGCSLTLK